MFNGRAAEAIVEYKQAIRLNPRAQIFVRYLLIGYSLTFLGQYDEAILWFQKSLAVNLDDSALNRGNAMLPSPQHRHFLATPKRHA